MNQYKWCKNQSKWNNNLEYFTGGSGNIKNNLSDAEIDLSNTYSNISKIHGYWLDKN